MKKITAIILCAIASLTIAAPALSGCGGDGVKFTLSADGSHYIVSFSGLSSPSGEYEIPATYGDENIPVTEIADEGFATSRFTKIIVPDTVTKIGVAAFSFCYSLQTVEFAEGINLEKIEHGTFGHCEALQQITLPDSVKAIDGLAFSGCTKLESVTMNCVESIGVRAFESCTALEEITLPSTLTRIGNMAFYFSGLKSVESPDGIRDVTTVDGNGNESTVYGLGYACFNGCTSLESVKIGEGVKTIPSGAFGYCTSLKEIHLPLSLEEIQGPYYENGSFRFGHAFYYCSALTDIYFNGSEEQWKDIKVDYKSLYASGVTMDNDALKNANKHFSE